MVVSPPNSGKLGVFSLSTGIATPSNMRLIPVFAMSFPKDVVRPSDCPRCGCPRASLEPARAGAAAGPCRGRGGRAMLLPGERLCPAAPALVPPSAGPGAGPAGGGAAGRGRSRGPGRGAAPCAGLAPGGVMPRPAGEALPRSGASPPPGSARRWSGAGARTDRPAETSPAPPREQRPSPFPAPLRPARRRRSRQHRGGTARGCSRAKNKSPLRGHAPGL